MNTKLKIKSENVYSWLVVAVVALISLFLLRYASSVAEGVVDGIALCIEQVIPSLYPFLILTSFLGKQNIHFSENNPVSRVFTRLLHLPSHCLPGAVMAAVGGFPAGLKLTESLYQSKQITHPQAKIMAACCHHAGPAFLITAVGQNMFGSKQAGLVLMSSTLLSAFLLGLLAAKRTEHPQNMKMQPRTSQPFAASLVSSVAAGAKAMYTACIWICIFMGLFRGIEAIFGSLPSGCYLFAEVTTGCMHCADMGSLPLAAAACGFGGFCVHCQMLPVLLHLKIKYRYFFMYRLLHSALAYGICFLLEKLFLPTITVSLSLQREGSLLLSAPQILLLGAISAVLIWDTAPKRQKDY